VLDVGGHTFVGVFSEGGLFGGLLFDAEMHRRLRGVLGRGVPLERILGVAAWEYFHGDDFRSAIVHATSAIERVMTKIVRKRLANQGVATGSQVDRFIEETSNRLLCTVVFGQLGIGDEPLRNRLAEVFEVRNGLVHQAALDRMEKLFDLSGTDADVVPETE
jgi:hypothetical protein